MLATTFVLRIHRRIDELVSIVTTERFLRAVMLEDLASEILAFVAIETEFFFPLLRDVAAPAHLQAKAELAGIEDALMAVAQSPSGPAFTIKARTLLARLRAHEQTLCAIASEVEKSVPYEELEALGNRMDRFHRATAEKDDGDAVSLKPVH